MFNSTGYSLSDIAAATGNNGNRCCGDDGFGGSGAWWIIILFLFVFCGLGNNGWGNNGNGANSPAAQGALTRADLCSEFNFNGVERSLAGIQNGLCDGFYAQNTNQLNGFYGVQTALNNGFNGVDNAICSLGYNMQNGFNQTNIALMQGQNALSTQLANCCCENRQGQADIKYQMATDTCAIQTSIANAARDITDVSNNNARMIYDVLVQNKIDAKNERIAEQAAQIQALQLKASQEAQNNYLVSTLRPCPTPSYVVPNPYCCYGNTGFAYGNYNNNCGCGSCANF